MFYKNWPYWLKGGIIIDSIAIMIYLFYVLIWTNLFSDNFAILLLLLPGLYSAFFLPGTNGCFTLMSPPQICPIGNEIFGVLVIILNIVFYFVVGMIIGLIYGKIKDKK